MTIDCDDCGEDDAGPMLHDAVWSTIAEPHNSLCLICMEIRLGRDLVPADLIDCPWNRALFPQYFAEWSHENVKRTAWFKPPHCILQLLQIEYEDTEYRMRLTRDSWQKADHDERTKLIGEWRACVAMQRRMNTATEMLERYQKATIKKEAYRKRKEQKIGTDRHARHVTGTRHGMT